MQHVRVTGTSFVGNANPESAARSRGRPFFSMVVPFPIACFTGALITDLAYWRSTDVMWETFSDWLITAGMALTAVAIIAGVIDLIRGKRLRIRAWPYAVGYILAALLSLMNAFVHSRDGYTAVVPQGLTLSALVVVILLVTGWAGSAMAHRNRKGLAI